MLGADQGKLLAAIEGEVRDHLRQLAGTELSVNVVEEWERKQ